MTRIALLLCGMTLVASLGGCGTRPAPDFRGRWTPVNAVDEVPRAIALQPRQQFTVTPADRSLKQVVERWAEDSGVRASYRAPTDFSIHLAATRVSASTLETAVEQLSNAYAAQGVSIQLQPTLIVVAAPAAGSPALRDADPGASARAIAD